jgi:hypothetical protein
VFLSGYAYGLVYMRALEQKGFVATYRKSIRRACQLYVANLATVCIALGMIAAATKQWNLDSVELNRLLDLPSVTSPMTVVWRVMSFRLFPYGFDILDLYMALLLIAPVFLLLIRRNPVTALVVSGGIYAAAQLGVTLTASLTGVWFNPLAWQLLFVLGIYLSWRPPSVPGHPAVIAVATGLLAAAAVGMARFHLYYPYSGKANMEPLRLLHFMTLVYVTATVTRGWGDFWRHPCVTPVVVTGQQGLGVFCLGLLLTFGGCALMLGARREWPFVVVVLLAGCMASIGFAHVLRWIKRRRHGQQQEQPAAVALK